MVSTNARIVFILGIDREKVAAGLAVKHEKLVRYLGPAERGGEIGLDYGYNFVEKFIQIPFLLPSPAPAELDDFLEHLAKSGKPTAVMSRWQRAGLRVRAIIARLKKSLKDRKWHTDNLRVEVEEGPSGGAVLKPGPRRQAPPVGLRLEVAGDSDEVLEILKTLAPSLDANPRRLKQFLNLFRLRTLICEETGLFDKPQGGARNLTLQQLGKFVAIQLRFPRLLGDLERDPSLLANLHHCAESKYGEPGAKGVAVPKVIQGQHIGILDLLAAGCVDGPKWNSVRASLWGMAHVDVKQLLRVSPRVRTVDLRTPPDRDEARESASPSSDSTVVIKPSPARLDFTVPEVSVVRGPAKAEDEHRGKGVDSKDPSDSASAQALELFNEGCALRTQGKRDSATDNFKAAIETYRRLVHEEGLSEFADSLARTFHYLGNTRAELGEPDVAREDFSEAIQIYSRLVSCCCPGLS